MEVKKIIKNKSEWPKKDGEQIGEQNCDVKHKQSQLIGMDSVSDICKYHLMCFVTIIEVNVISGKKRSSKKFRDLEVRYMFLGQIFAKNAKNDPKTLF